MSGSKKPRSRVAAFVFENSIFLIVGSVMALVWANAAPESYDRFIHHDLITGEYTPPGEEAGHEAEAGAEAEIGAEEKPAADADEETDTETDEDPDAKEPAGEEAAEKDSHGQHNIALFSD
jgi:hypothetical protein